MLNPFKRKQNSDSKIAHKIFDYFKFEKTDKESVLLGDFTDKDFSHWLALIHCQIQGILKTRPLEGNTIENYVNITMYLGRQRVDVSIIKDGCKSPHELLQEEKNHKPH
jgi:hypothetical protein